jgi:hypothetical protein
MRVSLTVCFAAMIWGAAPAKLEAATNENAERNGYENPNGKEGKCGHFSTASLRSRAAYF